MIPILHFVSLHSWRTDNGMEYSHRSYGAASEAAIEMGWDISRSELKEKDSKEIEKISQAKLVVFLATVISPEIISILELCQRAKKEIIVVYQKRNLLDGTPASETFEFGYPDELKEKLMGIMQSKNKKKKGVSNDPDFIAVVPTKSVRSKGSKKDSSDPRTSPAIRDKSGTTGKR